MDRETRPCRPHGKGTAASSYESAVVAYETNHWWFIQHLHEAGWSDDAIATHFALSTERVRKIVAAAFPGAPYLAGGAQRDDRERTPRARLRVEGSLTGGPARIVGIVTFDDLVYELNAELRRLLPKATQSLAPR